MAGDRSFVVHLDRLLLLCLVLCVGVVNVVKQLPQLGITSAASLASSCIFHRRASAGITTPLVELSLHNLRIAAAHRNLIDIGRVLGLTLRTSLAL